MIKLIKEDFTDKILQQLCDKIVEQSEILSVREFSECVSLYDLIIAIEDDKIIGYAFYAPFKRLNLNTVLDDLYYSEKCSEYVEKLNSKYGSGIYVKALEVFENFKYKGIGTTMYEEISKSNVPLLLYATPNSIDFWDMKGFKFFEDAEYYWMILKA